MVFIRDDDLIHYEDYYPGQSAARNKAKAGMGPRVDEQGRDYRDPGFASGPIRDLEPTPTRNTPVRAPVMTNMRVTPEATMRRGRAVPGKRVAPAGPPSAPMIGGGPIGASLPPPPGGGGFG